MRRFHPLLAIVAAAVSALPTASAGAAEAVAYERLAGPTRYETAAAIGREYWEVTGSRISGAVLTRGDGFADSLAAANVEFGVPLLTARDRLSAAARWTIADLNIRDVDIVGGTSAVSQQVEDELREMGVTVARIAGADRYATAAETFHRRYGHESDSPEAIGGKPTVLLATGENFPDALAAAPLANAGRLPLLLTPRNALPAETRHIFEDDSLRCPNGVCIEQVILLGGTAAISTEVEGELRALGLDVRRVAGTTRQETAVRIARLARDEAFPRWDLRHFNLARGDTFPDALAGGRLGGAERAVTLLTVSPTDLGADTRAFLRENSAVIESFHVFGDESAINDNVVAEARAASTT